MMEIQSLCYTDFKESTTSIQAQKRAHITGTLHKKKGLEEALLIALYVEVPVDLGI